MRSEFSPSVGLKQQLISLKGQLFEPFFRLHWRADRLLKVRHDRAANGAWRAVRRHLLQMGVPASPFRIVAEKKTPAAFWWEPNRRPIIFLPARAETLMGADHVGVTGSATDWSELLVFLHEWGHALLHPPHQGAWANHISAKTMRHAHPAWAHIDAYLGWRVFNEMFADVFSAAWLLVLSERAVGAVDLLRHMKRERIEKEKMYTMSFPCRHPTGGALDLAMRSDWQNASVDELMSEVLSIADQSFVHWLDNKKGEQMCQSSLDHLHAMEELFTQKRRRPLIIYGRSWQKPGLDPNEHSAQLLRQLELAAPHHPIFGFDCTQKTLGWAKTNGLPWPMSAPAPSGAFPSFV